MLLSFADRPAPTPVLEPGHWPPGNSYVLPEHKIVYISVTKVACTSLRWMIADLAGEDFQRFYAAPGNHQTRLMTIHTNRTIWQHSPQLKNVPAEQLAEISRDNGWFIFAVIRDPWSRLWSAWQSKFLVRHALYVENFGDQPWFPRVPRTSSDVLDDWRAFVAAKPWLTMKKLKSDPHFQPQMASVRPDSVNYSRIYDISDMSALTDDIHAHLQTVGKDQELYMPTANENPLRLWRPALDADVTAVIEDAYRADFARFGERWSLDKVRVTDEEWSRDALATVAYHGVANQRIGDLSVELKQTKRSLTETRQRAKRMDAEVKRLRDGQPLFTARGGEKVAEVRRKIRRVVRKTRAKRNRKRALRARAEAGGNS